MTIIGSTETTPAKAARFSSLSARPPAATFGEGFAVIGTKQYVSDGTNWTEISSMPHLGTYTWATIPAAASYSGSTAFISDIGGGVLLYSNGTIWRTQENAPVSLVQTAIPIVLPSSGSIGNNGALTGLTALPSTFTKCYMYFPADAIVTGSAAGLYYVVMSSTTAGTIYNNTYSSGTPTIPASPTAFATTGPGAFTQTTASAITLFSATVPAGLLGTNGELKVELSTSCPSTADDKITACKLGTATLGTVTKTTSTFESWQVKARNRGTAALQLIPHAATVGYATVSSAAAAYATQNTATDLALTLVATLEAAADFVVLESFSATVSPA